MALWMEASSTPDTEQQQADMDAINALRESATIELKEKGNEYVKMGKKHYADAIDCYTRAINQKISNNFENSILFANRAHVNLLLGNYRRALTDAEEAIKINSANVKAYYRGAKAALALDLLPEAAKLCRCGLEQSPLNEELKKLEKQVKTKKAEIDKREHQASEALSTTEVLVSALENRNLKLGRAMYKDLTGVRKPKLDKSGILHWPVLLLYGEVMSSDFIEDFCEHDMFSTHLDMLFAGDSPPLPWDENHAYTREAVELYYQSNAGHALPKRKVFQYLLEDTAGAGVKSFDEQEADDKDMDADFASKSDKASSRWVKVNERKTLLDILKQRGYVIPGIPVFYLVSRRSSFYEEFVSGNWSPP